MRADPFRDGAPDLGSVRPLDERALLLWQIRWLIYFYATNRLYYAAHYSLYGLREQALESGQWDDYRRAYEQAYP